MRKFLGFLNHRQQSEPAATARVKFKLKLLNVGYTETYRLLQHTAQVIFVGNALLQCLEFPDAKAISMPVILFGYWHE